VTLAVSATLERADRKAATAVEVALAAASPGDRRLLLVDADFRNPSVAALLGMSVPDAADFTSELARRLDGKASAALGVLICTPTLHLLPATPSASGDLILTTHFEGCLRMLRDYYDLVIVNGPLISAGVYCTAIADVIDGVAVVGEGPLPESFSTKSIIKTLNP
jgi:Mrp family chromosome partitioning ATPase